MFWIFEQKRDLDVLQTVRPRGRGNANSKKYSDVRAAGDLDLKRVRTHRLIRAERIVDDIAAGVRRRDAAAKGDQANDGEEILF
jgi:hypothetical protein